MSVSFIIPAHNEEKYIEACVRGAFSCDQKEVERVIVVSNASTDGTIGVLGGLRREFGDKLLVIDLAEKGLSRARQAGLDAATSEYIVSVDADCRPTQAWFSTLKGLLTKGDDVVCASGPYEFYDLPQRYRALNACKEFVLSAIGRFTPIGRSQMCGGNFMVRRQVLIDAGGFDVSNPFYGEDVAVEQRLNALGRVSFSRAASIPSSARRIIAEGLIRAFFLPRINRYFQLLRGAPLLTCGEKDWR